MSERMTVQETIEELKTLISYFRNEYDAVPVCLERAIELLEKIDKVKEESNYGESFGLGCNQQEGLI